MTTSKFTIASKPCFYINNVIIYRVIFFSDQHHMSIPAAAATRLRAFCFTVRTTGPQSLIRDSEIRIPPKTEGFDPHPSRWQVCGVSCVSVCIYSHLVWVFISFAAEIVMWLIKGVLLHTPLGMWLHVLYGSWRALLPLNITNNAEFRNASVLKIFVWGIVDLCKRNDRKWQKILVR